MAAKYWIIITISNIVLSVLDVSLRSDHVRNNDFLMIESMLVGIFDKKSLRDSILVTCTGTMSC